MSWRSGGGSSSSRRLFALCLGAILASGSAASGLVPPHAIGDASGGGLHNAAAAQGTARGEVARRLSEICGYLESGTTNQQAASLRQLQESITIKELAEFRAYLLRPLAPAILGPLRAHFETLLLGEIETAEAAVAEFDAARRAAREFAAKTPEPLAEEAARELAALREKREAARQKSHDSYRALLAHGYAIAPVLWSRIHQKKPPPYHVARFHARLHEDLAAAVRLEFPSAPRSRSLPPFLRRALVPLIPDVHGRDPKGWDAFREEVAAESLDAASGLHPERWREARAVFLELGDWGQRRLVAWVADPAQNEHLSASLRSAFAERNLLAVPAAFDRSMGLDLGAYRAQPAKRRRETIQRLEWTAGERAVPIFARLLEVERERFVQVAAAVALARLGDRRGGEFLERLSFEESAEIASLSRAVLIIDARQRREAGEAEDALQRLLELLRRFPGDFELHFEIGITALGVRDFELAMRHFQRAIAYQPENMLAHYNLACALALRGRSAEAMRELEQAVEAGFDDFRHIEEDPDLESLRELPVFRALLARLAARDRGR